MHAGPSSAARSALLPRRNWFDRQLNIRPKESNVSFAYACMHRWGITAVCPIDTCVIMTLQRWCCCMHTCMLYIQTILRILGHHELEVWAILCVVDQSGGRLHDVVLLGDLNPTIGRAPRVISLSLSLSLSV